MKNLITTALFIFFFVSVYAQNKIKFTKKNFTVSSIFPSEFSCLDDVLTQSAYFQIADKVPVSAPNLKRDFFKFDGYIKDAENGNLKIYVTIPPAEYLKSKVDTIYDKKTLKIYFVPSFVFSVNIKIEVKCNSQRIYLREFKTQEKIAKEPYLTIDELKKGLSNIELRNEYGAEIEKSIYISLYKIQEELNRKLGYLTNKSTETFVFLTNKEHPEYAQMLEFEHEITAQMSKFNLEKGLDAAPLVSHLAYLEGLLTKYPESSDNTKIRFIVTNNLAQVYFLLENEDKALFFSELLIKNDMRKIWGRELIDRTNNARFVNQKVRHHLPRFTELQKLGFQMQQEAIQEKEDTRLAFFEKIERDITDWEQEKANRLQYIETAKTNRISMLDSTERQNNPALLKKIIDGFGSGPILKGVEKVHILSKLTFEETNIPVYDEKWGLAFTNYLLKKKNPDLFYVVVNQAESWQHDDRVKAEKWKKVSGSDYLNLLPHLDPLYLLSSFRLDLWNNYELLADATIDGRLCYHLSYVEKMVNSSNRTIPKTEHHLYIDKENNRVISSEKTEFEDGKKLSFERKIYQDYRELIRLNSGAVPHKILYQVEDFYGESFYQEEIEKIEINSGFANRIFIKEVYSGGFK
ncbi:MAG: hypothetical protein EAZ70_09000 [Runella slithyformis]|nr:MAG: hypothetical protein EAY79_09610 [Runella slithyformis]TAF26309.1 MAG: hypothetical protein EAZ70_09000 [Runella slithyformis]TAF44923.1 MAG: hypothetical protein EAZ63_11590 [Runella slithyformis]TAF80405.1 MAG: hypothetical protein EAZ50_08990 [Runella slithyformis]